MVQKYGYYIGYITIKRIDDCENIHSVNPFVAVCSCHVRYTFQSEPTLYSYLNVKKLLATIECGFIQATIECAFTLKRVCDMTRTYTQMLHTDKYLERSSFGQFGKMVEWSFTDSLILGSSPVAVS